MFHGNDKQNNWQSVKCLPERWCDMKKLLVYSVWQVE